MAEILTGKLSFDRGKWKIVFFDEKRQRDMTLFCQKNVFAKDLAPKENEETEVHFERDATPQRNAIRVRAKGAEWKDTTPAAPKGRDRSHKKLPGDFHNPYNFVPAIPRDHIDGGKNELGDREPSGHDRFLADKFSGKLRVRMKVETPMLLPDTVRMDYEKETQHKSYPVRVDENGNPFINPTAIKGMLRSAYEAVTNSRLSVFQNHGERLAFRMEASQALSLVPVRIHPGKEIHFYEAAWLGKYKGQKKNWKNLDTHRRKVWVKVRKRTHQRRGFPYFEVVDLEDINKPKPSIDYVEGYVCITNENMQKKHDERVFFKTHKVRSPEKLSDQKWETLQKSWENLIANYQEIHKDEHQPPANLKIKEWSRQIKEKGEEILDVGTLCYASVKKNSSGNLEVENLFPVMISRKLYEVSPDALLSEHLRPAIDIKILSPADRVFGWVSQVKSKSKQVAYRGQLRIGAVDLAKDNPTGTGIEYFDDEGLPLQILGQPKPQQGRFYVAQNQRGDAQPDGLKTEEAGYQTGKGLRGRKVYPHHANLPDDYWFEETLKEKDAKVGFQNDSEDKTQKAVLETTPKFFREYLRPKNWNKKTEQVEQQRDSQNRSVKGWVTQGTVFEFDVHFINLSDVEIGAVLWLLQLEPDSFHRFGGGKPLGCGSVHLSLTHAEICKGENLKKRYESFDGVELQTEDTQNCISKFKEAVEGAYGRPFEQVLFIKAFLKAATGFDKPIHYPRTRQAPNPEGESFEWFVANNKIERGSVKYGLVLPNLWDDDGLPILPSR